MTAERAAIYIVDLLPPMEDVNEAQWTNEWLKRSNPDIATRIFKGIDNSWPNESDLNECLGVVITGSTCSCMNDYPHTESLYTFFKTVICLQVPLLTICYSAQMLVRWLAGMENVVRLPEPHVGFIGIELLVDGNGSRHYSLLNDFINKSLISVSAQSDGFILPNEYKEFRVQVGSTSQATRFIHTASARKWKYQAFQLSDLPVLGIQFHPNWPVKGAETVFHLLESHDPNIVVGKDGTIDANEQCYIAHEFLSACRRHTLANNKRNQT